MEAKTGTAATLAIVAAVGSFILTCMGRPGVALLAALVSIPLGVVGLVMSVSPRVSGGILSIAAIALGALGLIAALLGIAGAIVF
jgi:hypothetical protein